MRILLIRGWCCARSRFAFRGAPRGLLVEDVAAVSSTCYSNYLASAGPHYPYRAVFFVLPRILI